ncbi:hypothetical protein SD37_08660 [Amycolatopsis orientalis]|uniref:Uncharacterized protein n=1 Tax=Amycolatopsis orientalis TaxID=31958 RepID=A0A193BU65_AMYOR|nr:hypothetical protein SD37_08660 [Amycolatopsis orientalis]
MVLRLDVVMRRLALVGFVVFGAGGLAAVVVSLAGLARDIGYGLLFGLLSLGFAGLILLGLRRSAGSLVISAAGFSVPGVFEVRWTEVTRLRVWREKRRVGRWMHWWHYRLEWTGSGPDLLLEGDEYAYALGHLGGGARLYAALTLFAPAGVVELAE